MGLSSVANLGNNVLSYKTGVKDCMGNVQFHNDSGNRFMNMGSNDTKSLAGAYFDLTAAISSEGIKFSEQHINDINTIVNSENGRISQETTQQLMKADQLYSRAAINPLTEKESDENTRDLTKSQKKYNDDYAQLQQLEYEKTDMMRFNDEVCALFSTQKVQAESQKALSKPTNSSEGNPFAIQNSKPALTGLMTG